MAKLIGRAWVVGRSIPSMECALVCLLLGLSLIGDAAGLDGKVRAAASGLIAGLYGEGTQTLRGVPIPKEAVARIHPNQPFGVQAQAGRNP